MRRLTLRVVFAGLGAAAVVVLGAASASAHSSQAAGPPPATTSGSSAASSAGAGPAGGASATPDDTAGGTVDDSASPPGAATQGAAGSAGSEAGPGESSADSPDESAQTDSATPSAATSDTAAVAGSPASGAAPSDASTAGSGPGSSADAGTGSTDPWASSPDGTPADSAPASGGPAASAEPAGGSPEVGGVSTPDTADASSAQQATGSDRAAWQPDRSVLRTTTVMSTRLAQPVTNAPVSPGSAHRGRTSSPGPVQDRTHGVAGTVPTRVLPRPSGGWFDVDAAQWDTGSSDLRVALESVRATPAAPSPVPGAPSRDDVPPALAQAGSGSTGGPHKALPLAVLGTATWVAHQHVGLSSYALVSAAAAGRLFSFDIHPD